MTTKHPTKKQKATKLTSLTFSSAARPSAITGTENTGAGTASTANDDTGAAYTSSVMRSCTSDANAFNTPSEKDAAADASPPLFPASLYRR